MSRSLLSAGALAVFGALAGCRGSTPPPPIARPEPPRYTPSAGSGNAYDAYLLAAQEAAKKAPERTLTATRLWPSDYEALEQSIGAEVNQLVRAANTPFTSQAEPSLPGPQPAADGIRLLVETAAHRMENHAKDRDWERALPLAQTLTRFGARWSQTGVAGALDGRNAISRSRRALSPNLASLGEGQLRRLASSLRETLEETPSFDRAYEFEREQGRVRLQDVFARASAGEWDGLRRELGVRGGQTLSALQGLDAAGRSAWYQELERELDRHVSEAKASAAAPAGSPDATKPWYEVSKDRPWSELGQNYLMPVRQLPDLERAYLAKTRLLALTALIIADAKRDGRAPANLDKFPASLTTDPYSLKPFLYRAAGREFRLYSVGENGLDDGGDSDRDGMAPDVTLESQPVGG